jgi:hypothetical protein
MRLSLLVPLNWPRPPLPLFSPCRPHSPAGGRHLLRPLRPRVLDVPIARSRQLSRGAAAGGDSACHEFPAVGQQRRGAWLSYF